MDIFESKLFTPIAYLLGWAPYHKRTKDLVKAGATPEHLQIYNECFPKLKYKHINYYDSYKYRKGQWEDFKFPETFISLITAKVSPETIQTFSNILVKLFNNSNNSQVNPALLDLTLKGTKPEYLSLYDRNFDHLNYHEESFVQFIQLNPTTEQFNLYEKLINIDDYELRQSIIKEFPELLKLKPDKSTWDQLSKLLEENIKLANYKKAYDLLHSYVQLTNIQTSENEADKDLFIKANSYYEEKGLVKDETLNDFVQLLKNNVKNPFLDDYNNLYNACNNKKINRDLFLKAHILIASLSPSETQYSLYKKQLQSEYELNNISWFSQAYAELIKANPTDEQFEIYRDVSNKFIQDNLPLHRLIKTFVSLLNEKVPNEIIASKLETYYKLLSFIKESLFKTIPSKDDWGDRQSRESIFKYGDSAYGNISELTNLIKLNLSDEPLEAYKKLISSHTFQSVDPLTKNFIDLLKTNPSNEYLTIYSKAISLYPSSYNTEQFSKHLIALINAKPSNEQLLMYILALESYRDLYDKEKAKSQSHYTSIVTLDEIDKLTLKHAETIKALNSYPALKPFLDKLNPKIKNQIEHIVIGSKSDNNDNCADVINALKSFIDTNPTNEQWDSYNKITGYHLEKGLPIVPLTNSFAEFISNNPSKENRDLYNTLIAYHMEHGFALDTLSQSLVNIFKTQSNKEQLATVIRTIEEIKNKERQLSSFLQFVSTSNILNSSDKLLSGVIDVITYFPEEIVKKYDLFAELQTLIKEGCSNEHIKLYKELLDFCIKNKQDFTGYYCNHKNLIHEFVKEKYPIQPLINFKNSLLDGQIKSQEDITKYLTEITHHSVIYKILRSNGDNKALKTKLMNSAQTDELPVPIYSDSNRSSYNPEAIKMQQETEKTLVRLLDVNYGFSALTFDCKRPPSKEPPLLTRFGNDVGKIEYINAKDINAFPGKGFSISKFNLNKVFVADKTNSTDPFHTYKKAWDWSKEIFDDLPNTEFVFTRGFIAIINKDEKFKLNGVPYSYLILNNHHHNKGCDTAYLVPTEVLENKLKNTKVPYEDYTGFSQAHKDANDIGLKLEELIQASNEIKAPVLNLGWGSNFAGGLCNAYPLDSEPLFAWEKELRDGHTKDVWGHVHKSHITGDYTSSFTSKLKAKLEPLKKAHDDIYSITNKYQNLFDIFRISFALWHKGQTIGERTLDPTDDELSQGFENQKLDLNDINTTQNPNSLRMLVEAYKWHEARKNGIDDPNYFPILIIKDTFDYWTQPKSPIMLDTYDMTFHMDGKNIPFSTEEIGDIEKEVWSKLVIPQLIGTTKDLVFYDRRDLPNNGGTNQ